MGGLCLAQHGYTSDMTVSVLGSVAMFQGSANKCVRGQQSTKVRSVGRLTGYLDSCHEQEVGE
jgi:hypothetical protein